MVCGLLLQRLMSVCVFDGLSKNVIEFLIIYMIENVCFFLICKKYWQLVVEEVQFYICWNIKYYVLMKELNYLGISFLYIDIRVKFFFYF